MFSILVILFCSGLCGLAYCSRKYNNPLKHLKKGWNVYTNMDDVNIPGVRVFPIDQLKICVPEPHSVLFVDEGGLVWDNRGFKSFDKGYTEFFKLQRKYKCKVYINSQDFDIDKKIRQLTDSMVLMTSIAGCIGVIRPILRKVALVEATAQGESRIADNLKFGSIFSFRLLWLPSYFKYFDSYAAPFRPAVDFRQVPGDFAALAAKSPLKALKINFRRSDRK